MDFDAIAGDVAADLASLLTDQLNAINVPENEHGEGHAAYSPFDFNCDAETSAQPFEMFFPIEDFTSSLAPASNAAKLTEIGGILSNLALEAKQSYEASISADLCGPNITNANNTLQKLPLPPSKRFRKPKRHRRTKSDANDAAVAFEEDESGDETDADRLIDAATKRRKLSRRENAFLRRQFAGSTTVHLAEDAKRVMGQANVAFVRKTYEEAIAGFLEVIRLAPRSHEPYHSLGLVYEEMGDTKRSVMYFFLAAQLNPGDVELWKRLAQISRAACNVDAAIYFMGRAVRQANDAQYSWERINYAFEVGYFRRAVAFLEVHAVAFPDDITAIRNVCDIYLHRLNEPHKALQLLRAVFDANAERTLKLGFTQLNYLVELAYLLRDYAVMAHYMDDFGPLLCIAEEERQRSEAQLLEDNDETEQKIRDAAARRTRTPAATQRLITKHFPTALVVKYAIAKVHVCRNRSEWAGVVAFLREAFAISANYDVWVPLAQAFLDARHFTEALAVYTQLQAAIGDVTQADYAQVCEKIADCRAGLGEVTAAIEGYCAVLAVDQTNDQAKLKLAALYADAGRTADARDVMLSVASHDPLSNDDDDNEDEEKGASNENGAGTFVFYGEERCVEMQTLHRKFVFLYEQLHIETLLASRPNSSDLQLLQNPETEALLRQAVEAGRILFADLLGNGFVLRTPNSSLRPFSATKRHVHFNSKPPADYIFSFEDSLAELLHKSAAVAGGCTFSSDDRRTLSALHGLTAEVWRAFVVEFVRVLVAAEAFSEALRCASRTAAINIIHFDGACKAEMRVLHLAVALRQDAACISSATAASTAVLHSAKWFIHHVAADGAPLELLYAVGTRLSAPQHLSRYVVSQRFVKLARRLCARRPTPALLMHCANLCLMQRSFTYAVHFYAKARTAAAVSSSSTTTANSLMALCVAVAVLHRATSRRAENRQFFVLQAFAMLHEALHKAPSPETLFNVARAHHFIGLLTLAAFFYRAALDAADSETLAGGGDGELAAMQRQRLIHASAHNLLLIYAKSGNLEMARHIAATRLCI